MSKTGLDPRIFFRHHKLECPFCQSAKFERKSDWQFREINPWTFLTEKKPKIWEKNSPKIQGVSQHHKVWNLSSPLHPASRDSKIAPLDPLGAEKFGVKILNLKPDF